MNKRKYLIIIICVVGLLSSLFFYSIHVSQSNDISSELLDPVLGEQTITVVPVITNDLFWTLPETNITKNVFVNVSEYFLEQSYGKVWLSGRIANPVYLEKNISFYARGSLNSHNLTIRENATEGTRLFANEVFSQLSWTGGNITKHVIFMYAGYSRIHPHHNRRSVSYNGQSTTIEYSVVPENGTLSTIAHEIAHGFQLDNLYNKDRERESEPVGQWGLMAHHGNSDTINDMCGYSRMRLGWIDQTQVVQVDSDSIHTLVDLNSKARGTKLLSIQLDDQRYFLVESRIRNERTPGVLITLLDMSRDTGGYGRLEVVRPFDAISVSSIDSVLLVENEQYTDPSYNISIRVLTENIESFHIEVKFNVDTSVSMHQLPMDGEVTNITTATLDNSTLLFTASIHNETSGVNSISLYRYGNTLELLGTSLADYEGINPVLLTYQNEYVLLYELVNGTRHSIIAQSEDMQYVISETDDARYPTSYRSYGKFYIAYENHTEDGVSIVIRSKSASNWNDITIPSPNPYSIINANLNGTPHSPKLIQGNNDASLAYIRTGSSSDHFEFRYDLENAPDFSIEREHITSFDIHSRTTYRFVFSLSDSYSDWSEVFHYDGYSEELENVNGRQGISVGVFGLLGIWHGYSNDSLFYLDRPWDAYKEQGVQLQVDIANSKPLAITLASKSGSPSILVFSSSEAGIEVTQFYISTLSIRPSSLAVLPIIQLVGLTASWCVLVLFIHKRIDEKIRRAVSERKHPEVEKNEDLSPDRNTREFL